MSYIIPALLGGALVGNISAHVYTHLLRLRAERKASAWAKAAEDQAWLNENAYVPLRKGSKVQVEIADPARSILTPLLDGPDYRFAGPTRACLCGNELFHAVVSFDEDKTIGYYLLDGVCHDCGASLQLPYETHEIGE